MLKVKNNENLVRDEYTNAVVNTNQAEYQAYLRQREHLKKQKEKTVTLESQINNMKDEISELKSLILQLAQKMEK